MPCSVPLSAFCWITDTRPEYHRGLYLPRRSGQRHLTILAYASYNGYLYRTLTEEIRGWGVCSWSWEEPVVGRARTRNSSPRSWVGMTCSLWLPQRRGTRTWRSVLPGTGRNALLPGER